jgi:hypothetical protein
MSQYECVCRHNSFHGMVIICFVGYQVVWDNIEVAMEILSRETYYVLAFLSQSTMYTHCYTKQHRYCNFDIRSYLRLHYMKFFYISSIN